MLRLSGLEGEYSRVRADESVLGETVDGLRSGEWDGLNVTMPLKAAAARASDSLSRLAALSGSVNTLVASDEGVVGHSTDSSTFRSLAGDGSLGDLSSVHVLGAGGSAAAAVAAIDGVAPVYLSSRRIEQAGDLSRRLGGSVVPWGTGVAGALLINTTPLGMSGESLPAGVLQAASGLIDLPYGDAETPAVASAREWDLPVVDGHEFLLRQAMGSFAIWTGVEVVFSELSALLRND